MSIQFEFYRNPNSQGTNKKRYHARVVTGGKVDTDRLAREIHRETSMSPADVKAVLMALADKMAEHLGEGRKVHLKDIGYFQVNLRCKEEVCTIHGIRSDTIEFKSVSFRAENYLKEWIKRQKIMRSRNKPHSMPITAEKIDQLLTEHFATEQVITRRTFQFLCGQIRSTAYRLIKKLVEEGKLRNINTDHSPVYVPANGYYGSEK